jgi:hypothetical protein
MLVKTLIKLPKKDLVKIIINLQNYVNKDSLINNNNKKYCNIKIPKDKIYYWID